jgi:hypothetical protein
MLWSKTKSCAALDDMCKKREWKTTNGPLRGKHVRNLLLKSYSLNFMHASILTARNTTTLVIVARTIRSAPSKTAQVARVRDVINLVIQNTSTTKHEQILLFTDDCAESLVQQIECAVSSGTSFITTNTAFLVVPVLRHPLNEDIIFKLIRRKSDEHNYIVDHHLGGAAHRVKELAHMKLDDPCNIVIGGTTGDFVCVHRLNEANTVEHRVIVEK